MVGGDGFNRKGGSEGLHQLFSQAAKGEPYAFTRPLKNNIVFLTGAEADFSGKFHPFIKAGNAYPLYDEFNLAASHVEANGNAKIIFLDLALKVTRLIR